jgi:hypothetical protein
MNKITKSKVALLAAIMGIMLAASTLFSNVQAAPTTVLQGRGTEGSYTCGDGTENTNVGFNIFVQKQSGKDKTFKLSGSATIFSRDGFDSTIDTFIYGGKTGKNSFSLLSIDQFNNNLCPNDSTPSKGTISGQCNVAGAQVQFRFDNGGHGTFTGNIVCF